MKNNVKIYDLDIEYEIIHRKVKYPRLELKTDRLRLVLPLGYENHEKLLEKHKNWIYKRVSCIKSSMEETKNRQLDFGRTEDEFRALVQTYIESISQELDVSVKQVYFRKMTSRWGSCSSKKNININRYMQYIPTELIEYVVFHEMAHLVEMGHNKRFKKIISTKFANHNEMERELLVYWLLIKENIPMYKKAQSLED